MRRHRSPLPHPSAAAAALQQCARLQEKGRFAEALACVERVLAREPRNFFALWQGGRTLFMLQQLPRALAWLEAATTLQPDEAKLRFDLGTALEHLGRHEEAAASFRTATVLQPGWAKAWSHLGRAQSQARRHAEAELTLTHALTFSDYRTETLHHLGLLCSALGRHDEAIEHFLAAIRDHPRFFEAWNHLGNALAAQNKLEEALFAYGQSLAIEPKNASAKFNWALACLRHGRLNRDVWLKYEYRWIALHLNPQRSFRQPLWRGDEPVAGKTILLHADQGLGDTIQFARYATALAARGATVHLEVQPELKTLLQGVAGATSVIALGDPLPEFDWHCPLLSAPFAEDTRLETIPADIPYLGPPTDRLEKWRPPLANHGRLRVGVVWRGNPKHHNDANRSIAFTAFSPILATEGCEFVCLQIGLNPAESAAFAVHHPGPNQPGPIADFSDTAALVAHLDLVIAVDTSVAHLAGAMGKPVWLLLPFSPDWRWMLERDDSPWYPTMRLFRQPAVGDWAAVIAQVTAELLQHARDRAEPPCLQLQNA